ncbi:olfactory receptor 52N5-like, partial [Pundamilia nyererei]|uniref:Olfactory receptor 52N5-like n=1 Tax=Pundamilia nyererei TaxID=303518 RepID=A0A9Y6M804_9CICH
MDLCIGLAAMILLQIVERLKALKTCTSHLSLVAIYFLPALFIFTFGSTILPNARTISLSLATVMPLTLNPIIYGLQTQEIKESFQNMANKT